MLQSETLMKMNRWQALLITVTELRFSSGFCDLLISYRLLLGAPFEFSDLNFVCCKCAQAVIVVEV